MNSRILFLVLASLRASAVYAADAEAPAAGADTQERIEVTGSHIRRTDTEGVAPVETVTRKDLDKKAYDNLGDVVRDLGVNTFGSGTVSGNSTAPGNADISLRGLGASNTLVLLNGQRLPQDSITGTVDLNLVPMAAVERIEILKDGASAIYGSDALGGVVNIITKKDFEGTEVSATQTVPTTYGFGNGTKQTNISVVNGINGEKFNVVTAANFKLDSPLFSRDRPWSNHAYSNIGFPGSYSSLDSSGSPTTFYASPSCSSGNLVTAADGTHCGFKYSDYSEETPRVVQEGVLSEAHYELNSDWRLTARANYVHRKAETVAAPSPGNVVIPSSAVSQFGLPSGTTTAGQPLYVQVRLAPLGPRITDVVSNSYGALLGATHQLGHDWQLEVNTTFNLVSSQLTDTSGFALKSAVKSLISSGSFNPFTTAGGDLTSASYVPTESTRTALSGIEAKASGDLFEVGAGKVGLAVGTLVNYASYFDVTDQQTLNGNVFGNAGSSGAGHRTSEAIFSELSIPLVEKKLEAQLAGRFDHYSDFGSTVNPKIGLLYHAMPSLLFRGSVGTGFRAPLLNELNAAQSIGFPSFIDAYGCSKNSLNCSAQQYQVTSGGNPNLKEEKSQSLTLGSVWAPTGDLSFGTDWFVTKIKNVPGIDYHDLTVAEQNGTNPAKYGVTVNRDSSGNLISIVAPEQNLSELSEAGVDITAAYSYGKFKLSTEQNQIFYYKTEGFPGAGLTDKIGWNGLPRWRNTTTLAYDPAIAHDISLTARSVPGQNTLDNTDRIAAQTTYDISYTFKTKKTGDFTLGVINVFNSKPPMDNSNPTGPVNYSLYDPNGRQFVLGYRKML